MDTSKAHRILIIGLFGWLFDQVRNYESCGLSSEVS